jgi:histidyl-tRNA synthetase
VDYPLGTDKVARQFKDADALGARFALIVGAEWPAMKLKDLKARTESDLPQESLADWAGSLQTPAP